MDRPPSPFLRWSEIAYGWLLLLYPAEFRHEYAGQMRLVFHTRSAVERERRGVLGLTLLWLDVMADLVTTAPKEHAHMLAQDIRYALRVLMQERAFTAIAVITLGLGIGANTAMFSVIDATLLRPLPYPSAEQLVAVWESSPSLGFPRNTPAPGNFAEWRSQSHSFTDLAAVSQPIGFATTNDGEPERIEGRAVTASLFTVLGIQPVTGRVFSVADDKPGAPRAVILSHKLWRRRFNAAPDTAGKQLVLDDRTYTIAGVMPPEFAFPDRDTELWIPQQFTPEQLQNHGSHYLVVIGRLKPGVSLERAGPDMDVVARRLQSEYPASNAGVGVAMAPLRDMYVGNAKTALIVVFAAVALVLLIACANVANLMLARAATRRREMAIRAAMGARRSSLARQLLTESVLLSLLGGVAGILLGAWGINALTRLAPPELKVLAGAGLNGTVFAFAAAVSFLTGLIFGIAPALISSKVDLNDALRDGGKGSSHGKDRAAMRNSFVVVEIALALVLLINAVLVLRSLGALRGADLGYRAAGLLTMRVNVPASRFGNAKAAAVFYDQLLTHIRAVPGVREAGLASRLPSTCDCESTVIYAEGRPLPQPGQETLAHFRVVSPEYLDTMSTWTLAGRRFDQDDNADARPVAVVSDQLARLWWTTPRNAIGKRFGYGRPGPQNPWTTVIGVVGDVVAGTVKEHSRPAFYVSYRQPNTLARMPRNLVLRTDGDPILLAPAVRTEIRAIDSHIAISDVRTMLDLQGATVAQQRFETVLLSVFAAIALTLAIVGVYGVLSYTVAQRAKEIGIRMALGAARAHVMRIIVWHSARLAIIGGFLGLCGALATSRALKSLVFGLSTTDAVTYATVSISLVAVAIVAAFVPVQRAIRIDPSVALRLE